MAQDLELQIKAKDEASTTIDKVSDSVDKLGKQSKETTSSTGGLWKSFAAGMTAANLIQKGIDTVASFMKQCAAEALEAEQNQIRLNSILRRSGEDYKVVGEQIDDFASIMKVLTGVDDDQIVSMQILARQYGLNTQQTEKAIKSAIALTEIGGTLEGNLNAVADAYNGNYRGLISLLPEIKNANTLAEKQAILEKAVADNFELATDKMQSTSGMILGLKNDISDLGKELSYVAISGVGMFVDSLTGGFLSARQINQKLLAEWIQQQELLKKQREQNKNQILRDEEELATKVSGVQTKLTDKLKELSTNEYEYKAYQIKKYYEELKKQAKGSQAEAIIVFQANVAMGKELDNLHKKEVEDKKKIVEQEKKHTEAIKTQKQEFEELWQQIEKTHQKEVAWEAFLRTKLGPTISDGSATVKTVSDMLAKATADMLAKMPQFNYIMVDGAETTKKWKINWKDANDVLDFSKNIISGITDILSSLGVELDDTAKSLLGLAESAGSLITGLISHNPAQVIQGVVGAISSLISLFKGHGVEQAIQRENAWMKLTKEQIEQIKELEKQYGSTHAATSELLDSFISSADITTDSFDQWAYRVREILSDLDQGKMTLAQTQKQIGDAFSALIGKAQELGTEGSKSLITFFDDLANRGIKVAEVQEYIQEQLAKGLEGYIAMKAAMEDNADATEAFGNINVEVYEEMIRYQNLVEQNKGLVNAIEGAEKALTSLSNTQKLTEEQFDSFATSASLSYEKLIEGGMNSSQALQTLTPYLQRLQFLHEQYGYTIDENTQKIIDQAIAEGRVVENKKTETQQIIGLLESIAEVLGAKIPKSLNETGEAATRAFDKAANGAYNFGRALDEVSRERDVYVTTHYNSEGEIPAAKGFQGWVSKPTRFLVGEAGPEFVSVTPRSRIGKGGKGGEISVSQNITINGVNLDKASLIEAIKTAIPNNTQGLKTIIQKAIAEA